MRTIRVHFTNGDSLTTRINGSNDEIIGYYVGKRFNVGTAEDNMQTCTHVEFLPSPVVVGQTRDTGAGNLWEVVEILPDDRIRVKCVGHTDGSPLRPCDGSDVTHVWHVSSFDTSDVVALEAYRLKTLAHSREEYAKARATWLATKDSSKRGDKAKAREAAEQMEFWSNKAAFMANVKS